MNVGLFFAASHMEAWVDDHPGWKSDWTKSSAIRNVQAAFNWAAKSRLIDENPFRGVTHHTGAPRRDMTAEEFQAILRNTNGTWCKRRPTPAARFRQVLIFLWFTGCRPKEATALRWTNIDFKNHVIVLLQHKTIRTQTQPRPRVIPLHPVVEKLLQSIQKRNEGELVFVTHPKGRVTPRCFPSNIF